MERIIIQKARQLMLQREEVMEAFVAKYGFEPERFVQVSHNKADGSYEWYVRRRSDQEMENLSRMSANL